MQQNHSSFVLTDRSFAESQAGELKDSLAEEVEDVRKEVRQVSDQKEEAQQKLASLQKELDTLHKQREEIKVSNLPSLKAAPKLL